MTVIGFRHFENQNVAGIFLSPILFYITACILEDYFAERIEAVGKREKEEMKMMVRDSVVMGQPVDHDRNTMHIGDDEDIQRLSLKDQILFSYDKLRFSIPYMIYQRLPQWRILDSIALNFHLVTATITIVLCTNW